MHRELNYLPRKTAWEALSVRDALDAGALVTVQDEYTIEQNTFRCGVERQGDDGTLLSRWRALSLLWS
jgi:hypothetical protein